MKTITFYSFKGGVGRSLLVANAARYLSTLGKTVFAIDLDLEAPGLHYKFGLEYHRDSDSHSEGVVETLSYFLKHRQLPETLADRVEKIVVSGSAAAIYLMRAGRAPLAEYWLNLSRINWFDIIYGSRPVGVPFFLELKERIKKEYNPDFILIDSRTGITEMGGIAATLMPDAVVCLALNSAEHLEGMAAVLRSITKASYSIKRPIRILPVLSRISSQADEEQETDRIWNYLRHAGENVLELDEMSLLHSEPTLEKSERILIGGKIGPSELPLLRDYLHLFSKLVPAEDIQPHVGVLIHRSIERLLDDPDRAQSDLEALTAYCADQEAYRALLKVYRLRKASVDKVLSAASLMWQLRPTNAKPDPLIVEIVQSAFLDERKTEVHAKYVEFAESVWRNAGVNDERVIWSIASSLLPQKRPKAISFLLDYVDKVASPSETILTRLVEMMRSDPGPTAFEIINRFKSSVNSSYFYVAWAKLVLSRASIAMTRELFADKYFKVDAVRASDPALMYRLLQMVDKEEAYDFLRNSLDIAASNENMPQLRGLAEVFYEDGSMDEFEQKVSSWVSQKTLQELMIYVRKRTKRPGLLRSYHHVERL